MNATDKTNLCCPTVSMFNRLAQVEYIRDTELDTHFCS